MAHSLVVVHVTLYSDTHIIWGRGTWHKGLLFKWGVEDVTEDEVGFLHNLKNESFFAVLCTVECTILPESAKELEKIFL